MNSQHFVNRISELNALKEEYSKKRSSLVVIYGRRRIGKTALILKFIKDKPGIYYVATEENEKENLKRFFNQIKKYFNIDTNIIINDWIDIFRLLINYLKLKHETKKFVIVIDEFPYLIKSNPATGSLFQKIWDEILEKENIMLILCGSYFSIMEQEVLNYKSPLYGRRTLNIHLKPLEFNYLYEFFPNYSFEDIINVWFVLGGIPKYLLEFNPKLSFWRNVKENILNRWSFLYNEIPFLLRDEFKEPKNYFAILKNISIGFNEFGKIANATGLDKSMLSKYLETLKNIGIIKEILPITATLRSKGRLYFLSDNYMSFWFRYIYTNIIDLEQEKQEDVLKKIKESFSQYAGRLFEDLIEWFIKKYFSYQKIGKWWHKDKEIDVVAINESRNEILFAECKWKSNINAKKVLKELKEKTKFVQWNNENRKEKYAIFAKSFRTKTDEAECMDLKEMERRIKKQNI